MCTKNYLRDSIYVAITDEKKQNSHYKITSDGRKLVVYSLLTYDRMEGWSSLRTHTTHGQPSASDGHQGINQ